jgi:hypothetical protein
MGMARAHSLVTQRISAVLGVGALFLAACSGTAPSPSVGSAGGASCMNQFTRWRDGGGQAGMNAVRSAVARYGTAVDVVAHGAITAGNLSQLETAADTLQAKADVARADPTPACLPALRHSYVAALQDFSRAASYAKGAARALLKGDQQRADGDARASTSALDEGALAMSQVAKYLSGLEASR